MENGPSSRNIRETLPTPPENSNARWPVMFAIEKATKLGNPKGNVSNGRNVGGKLIGAMVKSIK